MLLSHLRVKGMVQESGYSPKIEGLCNLFVSFITTGVEKTANKVFA